MGRGRGRAPRHLGPALPGALPRAARERPGHARRSLPIGAVRRAPPAHRLGPHRGKDERPQGRPPAGGGERGDDPRPGPLRRPSAGRQEGRRARRGDGLRGAPRPDLPARREHLADRGNHPGPRDRHSRPGHARRRSVLAGRRHRAPGRAGEVDRRVQPRGGQRRPQEARQGQRPRQARRPEPCQLPPGAAGGDAGGSLRRDARGRALPRRDRRLAPLRALPLGRQGSRRLGTGTGGEDPRGTGAGGRRDLVRRRHRHPPPRRRRAATRRPGPARA